MDILNKILKRATIYVSHTTLVYISERIYLYIYLKECKPGNNKDSFHTHVYSSTIHNIQAMEIAQMLYK
jgi:hypothetical protein